MADLADLRNRVLSVLASAPARKIDFRCGSIHVDPAGLDRVAQMIRLKALGNPIGIEVSIGVATAGAEASYDSATNLFEFPNFTYGANAAERATILHESVHALRDVFGGWISTPGGPSGTLYVEDEAAAYVSESLYHLYETGSPVPTTLPQGVKANAVARSIMGTPGALVSDADRIELMALVASRRVYQRIGVRMWTPSSADGMVPGARM